MTKRERKYLYEKRLCKRLPKHFGIMIPLNPSEPLREIIFSFDSSKLNMKKFEENGITLYTNRDTI